MATAVKELEERRVGAHPHAILARIPIEPVHVHNPAALKHDELVPGHNPAARKQGKVVHVHNPAAQKHDRVVHVHNPAPGSRAPG